MSNRARGHGQLRIAVMSLVVTLTAPFLGACTVDPAPPSTPDASPTATHRPPPSASSTPSPTTQSLTAPLPDGEKPTRPTAVDSPPTLEGATAVATYFVQLFPYAMQTNDVADFAALSHPDCAFCSSTQADVAGQVERREHTVGGGIGVTAARGTEVVPGRHFAIYLTIDEAPSHSENEFGMRVDDNPDAQTFAVEMAVVFDDDRWLVRAVSSEATSA
ncbi:DUF6318 family protein [Cellulomonas fimi]|uniref:DUF6318 family protein n=1 Tax=Cellulomonas fimi TaxID=1708 RepID=UPI00234D1D25|nr:DUF6318 family protein [Cellulomonas fimi]MDC7120204.1 DUF6318 family protein [Cellulomonas fimi]